MLNFLQTGEALYVLAALCTMGILTRWLTRNLYKRLIKESDNMALTRNKNLRNFKQKTENTYQMNQGIPKVKPYLERQMYDFKHMGVTLHGWNIFSNQMTLWCFLAGGAASFGSYWYSIDPYYIVLYGSVGIMAGLFTILVDHAVGIGEKRQQLFACLDNYLENILIYRLDQERDEVKVEVRRAESSENIRSIYPPSEDPEQSKRLSRRSGRQRVRVAEVSQKRQEGEEEAEMKDISPVEVVPASRSDVDYLKHSLEQIAAGRERERGARQGEDWLKDLNPDELRLIGEILQEYLT